MSLKHLFRWRNIKQRVIARHWFVNCSQFASLSSCNDEAQKSSGARMCACVRARKLSASFLRLLAHQCQYFVNGMQLGPPLILFDIQRTWNALSNFMSGNAISIVRCEIPGNGDEPSEQIAVVSSSWRRFGDGSRRGKHVWRKIVTTALSARPS